MITCYIGQGIDTFNPFRMDTEFNSIFCCDGVDENVKQIGCEQKGTNKPVYESNFCWAFLDDKKRDEIVLNN